MNFKAMANLSEMKLMSGGNPQKMAEYAIKKHEYEQLKASHFSEEFPFVNTFSEGHLEELKTFAEDNPDDEAAQVRYALQKERFAVQESGKTAHIDRRNVRSELRNKLAAGEPLTKDDLVAAEKLARLYSTPDNLVMYSQIKSQLNQESEE